MEFAAAPLLAGLGVLLTAGVVLLLYWVRPEPQPVVVPSNLIWQRVLDERRHREDFWRWLISLAIALAAAIAVALALARPIPAGGRAGRVVLVMDNSPSMAASVTPEETRWDRAFGQAARILASGGEASEFLLLDTAGQRGGRSFSGRRAALEALENLAPIYGAEHRFPDLSDLLEPDAGTPGVEVIFIGDGVMAPAAPEGVERISVFEAAPNAGITAFDVRSLPTDPGRFEAFLEVVRHGAGRTDGAVPAGGSTDAGVVVLQIDGAGGASVRRTLRVEEGTPLGETVSLTGFVAGPVRAVIAVSGEDALAADDVAHSYVPSRNRLRVLLAGEESPYWEAALRLDQRVSLSRPDPPANPDPEAFDLWVIEGAAPPTPPPGPVLFAGSGAAEWLPARLVAGSGDDSGSAAAVTLPVRPGKAEHPLIRGLDFADALAREVDGFDARAVEDSSEGSWEVLLGDAQLGLLAARELPRRGLAFAFPLSGSNLPLQPDFPVFVSRALSWLTDVEVRRAGLGQVRMELAAGAIFDAEGREVPSRRLGSEVSFQAAEPSLYYAAGGGREIVVAASLLDRRVSDLNRSAWADEPPAPLSAAGTPAPALWPLFALFALLLLVAEWVAFHRHATV